MKIISFSTVCVFFGLATLNLCAADNNPAPADPKFAAVLKEIQEQQALIADNQTKIDAQLAVIAESLRTARIYASRTGR